jgi:L-rhamnose mutarotase
VVTGVRGAYGDGRSREAWVMGLKPGQEEIYNGPDDIWPEMLELMK